MRHTGLLLAHRAKERRSAGLHHAFDGAAAIRRRARLGLAIVNPEIVLEIAQLAIGAAVIATRRAAGRDGVLEHGLDGIDERLRALGWRAGLRRDRGRAPLGRKSCAVERLTDIDVA